MIPSRLCLFSLMIGLAGACGGATENSATAPEAPADAGAPPAIDAAVADDPLNTTYPAPHAPIPLVDLNGGHIMTSPNIVTVTFDGDPLRDRLESFGDTITATPWWDVAREGYCNKGGSPCVGRGTAGEHVHLSTPAAASYTDSSQGAPSSIQQFIKDQVASGAFPVPTSDTLYAIYFPDGVSVDLDGATSCASGGGQGFGAYHNTLRITPPAPLGDGGVAEGGSASDVVTPYAIIPRCGAEDVTTVSASHEFIEAATDPDIGVNDIAFYMQDQLWAFAGGEVGDLCVDFVGAGNDVIQESGFSVQRSWSNNAAKASHDPCVPGIPGDVYFNAAPRAGSEQISLSLGKSKTITLDAFSDGPMEEWTVSAVDYGKFGGGTTNLDFVFDKTNAHNGSHINLTITLSSKPASGYAAYAIVSKSPGRPTRLWPGVVLAN